MLLFEGVRVTRAAFCGCEGERCCLLWVWGGGTFVAFYGCEGDRCCLLWV